jgi:hypothetical protein
MAIRFLVLLTVLLFALAPAAEAVEYRLRVVSLLEEAFARFVEPGGLLSNENDRLDGLEAALDGGRMPAGAVLYDRRPQPVIGTPARAFGAVPAGLKPGPASVDGRVWAEVAWEGTPGERTAWVIQGSSIHYGELRRVGLKGRGPLRHVLPSGAPLAGGRLRVMTTGVEFLDFWTDRPDFWSVWLEPRLDLRDAIAGVVGRSLRRVSTDRVYLVVEHPDGPATYTAILGWREYRHQPLNTGDGGGQQQR